MKLAAQSDFFIKNYGLEEGLKRLKNIGYEAICYTIDGRYDQPFTTEWTDKELSAKFCPIGETIRNSGLQLLYTSLLCDSYNQLLPHTTEARMKMCVQALKATYYMGGDTFAFSLPMAGFGQDSVAETKVFAEQYLDALTAAAAPLGMTVAVFNNPGRGSSCYSYGSLPSELLELTEKFGVKVILDPANAHRSCSRISQLINELKDKIFAFALTEVDRVIPLMGAVNYPEVINELGKLEHTYHLVVDYNPVFKRYCHFLSSEGVTCALETFLYDIAKALASQNA